MAISFPTPVLTNCPVKTTVSSPTSPVIVAVFEYSEFEVLNVAFWTNSLVISETKSFFAEIYKPSARLEKMTPPG